MNVLYDIGHVFSFFTIIGVGLFTFFYGTRSRWMDSLVGKALLSFSASLFLIALSGVAVLVFGPGYPLRGLVVFVTQGIVMVTTWTLFFTLRRVQRASKKEAKAQKLLDAQDDTLQP